MIFASLNCSLTPSSDGLEQMTGVSLPRHPIVQNNSSIRSNSSDIDLSSESSLSPVATSAIQLASDSSIIPSSESSSAICNDNDDDSKPTRISFTIDSILGRSEDDSTKKIQQRVTTTPPESCSSYKSMATSLPDLVLPDSSMRTYMDRFGRPMSAPHHHHHHFIGTSPWPYQFLPYLSRPVLTSAYQAAAYPPSVGCPITIDTTRCSKGSSLVEDKLTNKGSSLAAYPDGGRVKRVRTVFTQRQIERLEREFSKQHYMIGPERYCLARQLNLNESQVKVWFQNRRIKWRKQQPQQRSRNTAATNSSHPLMSKLDVMRYNSEQQIIFHRA